MKIEIMNEQIEVKQVDSLFSNIIEIVENGKKFKAVVLTSVYDTMVCYANNTLFEVVMVKDIVYDEDGFMSISEVPDYYKGDILASDCTIPHADNILNF